MIRLYQELIEPSISGYEPLRSDIYLHYIVDASAVQLGNGMIGHALENAMENAHAYLDPVISNSLARRSIST